MKILQLIIVLSLMISPATLVAKYDTLHSEFRSIDLNFDGYIDLNEADLSDFFYNNWGKMDLNSDQYIDFVEYREFNVNVIQRYEPPINEDDSNIGAAIYE